MKKENTKSIAKSLGYDWNNLKYAEVAGQYLEQLGEKGLPYAKKSLEIILEDCEIKDPWIVKTVTDPNVLAKTIQSQLETYNQCRGEQTVGDLLQYQEIEKYLGGNMKNAEVELNPFLGENYENIIKKVAKAKYIIEGKEHDISSDKDVEDAKRIMKKYEKLIVTMDLLEQKKTSEFRNRVEDGVIKDSLKKLYTGCCGRKECGGECKYRATEAL
jgi:hypothetical protein